MSAVTRVVHRLIPRVTLLAGLLAAAGCGWSDPTGWRAALDQQTAQLGYRNWIVVAEASFPAHSRTGIRQVQANAPVPEVLEEVLRALERTEHVRPRIYLTRELAAVENDFAPGIDEFRRQIEVSLHGRQTTEIEQESLMTLIENSRKTFDVLVIRSSTALPYTSVFLELEPGYWDGESEQRLRRRLAEGAN